MIVNGIMFFSWAGQSPRLLRVGLGGVLKEIFNNTERLFCL